jgi:hypothetical protein
VQFVQFADNFRSPFGWRNLRLPEFIQALISLVGHFVGNGFVGKFQRLFSDEVCAAFVERKFGYYFAVAYSIDKVGVFDFHEHVGKHVSQQQLQPNEVRLYREGVFWVAYEQSA